MSLEKKFDQQFLTYEINTWVWLSSLQAALGRPVNLSSVPASEWDVIASHGFRVVWLMGVWERSPAGKAIADRSSHLLDDLRRCLPDLKPEDNVGSAYCVRRYVVDAHLGGPEGLAVARQELAQRGIRLLLDFVPNHAAPDAPAIQEYPEQFMAGAAADLEAHPEAYVAIGGRVFACGRDPFFPPWPDVIQVNAFHPGYRARVVETLLAIAQQCDGVRCDMAMLLINDVFRRTWGNAAGTQPAEEFWPFVIHAIRRQSPAFVFIAEAYWDLEWTLQQHGFAFCYDKRLYDLIAHDDAEGVRHHLDTSLAYQEKLIRFIENHDEPRAAALFSPAKARAAAVLMTTIPGAKLIHEGQLEGRRIRVPVFLDRRPDEAVEQEVADFWAKLLAILDADVFRRGAWQVCTCSGWPDNTTSQNLLTWCWALAGQRRLVVVNLSIAAAEARVHLPWSDLQGRQWRLADVLSGVTYDRDGNEMQDQGLYVALGPWACHLMSWEALVE